MATPALPYESSAPVAVQYCATFLKPEMLHIYRQITGLRTWRPHVLCQKLESAKQFPFPAAAITVLPKPLTRALRRCWVQQVCNRPVQIYRSEAQRIAAELVRVNARVLQVYFGTVAVHLLPLLRRCPVPVVVSFHGADAGTELTDPGYRELALEVFALAKLILVRSNSLGARLLAAGCPPNKIRLHRTGIPLAEFPYRPRTAPADGAWKVLQACRLIPKKGLETTLGAFAQFSAHHPKAKLVIAGTGPLLAELQALAAKLHIADRVAFPGFLSQADLLAQFYQAHLFVHPSELGPGGNQEGVPNSMLEAMATGLPVVATRHGGIPEVVVDGVSGHLVSERAAPALAHAMHQLTLDPTRYAAMGLAAAQAVAAKHDQRRQVAVLEALYQEAVQ